MEAQELNRRRKLVIIPLERAFNLLTRCHLRQTHVMLPEPVGLPETARVIGSMLWFDKDRDFSIAFQVVDESFDEMPDSPYPPELHINWTVVEVPRAKGREKP